MSVTFLTFNICTNTWEVLPLHLSVVKSKQVTHFIHTRQFIFDIKVISPFLYLYSHGFLSNQVTFNHNCIIDLLIALV